MIFFTIFIVVKEGVKLFIREGMQSKNAYNSTLNHKI